ncbi:MAG: peptidoglycan-associated lipoprotein [Rhodospirillaceae bacterium]|nr:peptidoglycan-associated lipoprotein [Rhodospirillaceae bacterium]|tara:strand:- start:269 stop:805 length:537 start_codon:yes stop_codon:yes gene_type:complete
MTRTFAVIAILVLAGCGGDNATLPDSETGSQAGAASNTSGSSTGATTTGTGAMGGPNVVREMPGEGTGPLSRLVIYFDYDRSEIRSDFNSMLAAHGEYLATNNGAQVRLEGHADERGSREYNIGLGEQRAQAVRRILLLQGATASQLGTVSYGEERPAMSGSNDEAYSLNRRVELVYQ